jgi:hypothetical protein
MPLTAVQNLGAALTLGMPETSFIRALDIVLKPDARSSVLAIIIADMKISMMCLYLRNKGES